jgi:CPA1 family monovalent cation:H+ antiporter
MGMHSTFNVYVFLLLIIAFLVMVAQRIKIAFPIILVIGGLILSFIPGLPELRIDPEVVLTIFLPPLLYEAAWSTSLKDFYKWRRVILSFAFIIVIVNACVIAFVSSNLIPGFTLALGFLLGGIISPPDAISASTVMKSIDVPKRMIAIVEGESLLNDASSLIVFRFALAAIITGQFKFSVAAGEFVIVVIMGTLVGIAIAYLFYAIHRYLPTTPELDVMLTFITPYIMFIVAERFHFSGVLAVVSGGLLLSSKRQTMLSYVSRLRGLNVWGVFSFILNGFIFILIGLQLPVIVRGLGSISLGDAIKYSLIISGVLIVARELCCLGAAVFTRFVSRFITTADSHPGWREPLVFGWAGMRGVVSLAAALSIPEMLNAAPFPYRNLILFITFSVILVTLVFQGLTLPFIIKKLHLREKDYLIPVERMEVKIRKKLSAAAVRTLDEKFGDHSKTNHLISALRSRMENDVSIMEDLMKDGESEESKQKIAAYEAAVITVLADQRQMLQQMNRKAEVSEELIKEFLLMLDQEEDLLRRRFRQ